MKHKNTEKGQAIVLVVLLFVGLLAAAGLAVDAGRVYSARRSAQNAADNAALAAAYAICNNGVVSTAGTTAAATNGFSNGPDTTVTVSNPPATGPNAGNSDFVEVTITHTQPATITRLVYSGSLTNTVRAVARCSKLVEPPGDGYAMIVLHTAGGPNYNSPYDKYTLKSKAGGILQVNGNTYVNSASPNAYAYYVGNNPCPTPLNQWGVKAEEAVVVGGWYSGPGLGGNNCSGSLNPIPQTGVAPMPDPLADLDPPAKPSGTCSDYTKSSGSATLNPGCYRNISLSGSANITLSAGLYYLTGYLSVADSARLTGNSVFLYLEDKDAVFQDDSQVTLSAIDSGDYEGMVFWMDGDDGDSCDGQSSGGTVSLCVLENALFEVNGGTLYLPRTFVGVYSCNTSGSNSSPSVTPGYSSSCGNGNHAIVDHTGAQMIVGRLWVGCQPNIFTACGKGELYLTYDEDEIFGGLGPLGVELAE